jgi:GT2 family glycosyltransferase
MEVLIAEGMSSDRTRVILEDYSSLHPNIHWFENPAKITVAGLNLLIGRAKGEIILRMDAHSLFPREYVSKCVRYLNEYKVDNVGGVLETLPGADTAVARAIALALTSRFGVGGAAFRIGVSEPAIVDTVPFGCYRSGIFARIGLFNENLIRSEDNEFNARLAKTGGKILLHPEIKCGYFARPDIPSIINQYFRNGFGCVYSAKFAESPFFLRHLAPVGCLIFFAACMLLGIWFKYLLWLGCGSLLLYIIGALAASAILAVKYGWRHFLYLLIVFPVLHISYGIGSLWGICRLLLEGGRFRNSR